VTKTRVAMALAACLLLGLGSTRVAHVAPPSDACSPRTQGQVSAVLGVAVGAGEKILPNSTAMRGWEVPGVLKGKVHFSFQIDRANGKPLKDLAAALAARL